MHHLKFKLAPNKVQIHYLVGEELRNSNSMVNWYFNFSLKQWWRGIPSQNE